MPKNQKDAAQGTVFLGGVPTDVEVRDLRSRWPESEMKPGDVIPYEVVEEMIGAKRHTSRWASVTGRWRKIVERETPHLVVGTERGVGFKVLSAAEKLDLSETKLDTAARAVRRSYKVAARVEVKELDDDERARLSLAQHRGAAILRVKQMQSTEDHGFSLTAPGPKT